MYHAIGDIMENDNLIDKPGHKRNFILFAIAIFSTFAIFGVADIIRGTAIPRIQVDFQLSALHIGALLASNSMGYLTASAITAEIARKIGIKACHIIGLILIAFSGVLIFFSPTFLILVFSFFVLNFGFGMVEIAVGVIAAKIFTKNTGTMMNLAHFFFGAGATFSPIVSTSIMAVRFGEQLFTWRHVYLIVLFFALVPAIPVLIGQLGKQDSTKKKLKYGIILRNPVMWFVVMILTFGVISEAGIASWFVIFLETSHEFPSDRAALSLTLFFVCFTVSRLLLGPLIDRIGFIKSLIFATAFSGVMITLGVLLGRSGSYLIILAGIGVAPIFPTVMAVIAKLFSDQIELAMTAIITIMGIIIVPMNLLVGGIINQARVLFSTNYGDAGIGMAYSAGILFFGLTSFIAFVFALILRARQKKSGKVV